MRLGLWTLALLAAAAVAAATAGGTTIATSDGWWKGTVVLEHDLGMRNGQPRSDSTTVYRGSATLRIELTGPETANYDFRYSEELSGAPTGPYCPGQLMRSTTGSLKTTAAVKAFPNGSVLRVVPKVELLLTIKESNCPGFDGGASTRRIKLDYFEFAPGKSATTRWQGTGRLFCCNSNGEFPRPGDTSVTWDLTRVTGPGSPTKPGASGPLTISKRPFVNISKYAASLSVAVTRGGDPTGVKSASCTGSFKGGPRLLGKPVMNMATGTVNSKTLLYWPELRPLSGKPVTIVMCTFEHDEYTKACGKTFHVSVRVVADGTKPVTKNYSFVWKAPPVKRSC